MSMANQDMFDKMLGKYPALKKIKEENEMFESGYRAGFAAGVQAGQMQILEKIEDDGK